MIAEVNEVEFKNEIQNGLVLVDVFTPSCGPCKRQLSVLEQCESVIKIVKANAHDSIELAGQLGVRSVPTLIFYKDGTEVRRLIGLQPESKIFQVVNELSETNMPTVDPS